MSANEDPEADPEAARFELEAVAGKDPTEALLKLVNNALRIVATATQLSVFELGESDSI